MAGVWLSVFDAQPDNPVAERQMIGRLDVFRQIGAVCMKCIRKFFDGKAETDISVFAYYLQINSKSAAKLQGFHLILRILGVFFSKSHSCLALPHRFFFQ